MFLSTLQNEIFLKYLEKQIFLRTFAANKQIEERLMDYRIAYIIYYIRQFGEHFALAEKEIAPAG